MRRKLAAGNWKMNGSLAAMAEVEALAATHPAPACEILLCPPFPYLARMREAAADSAVMVGAQDCHTAASGAHTGDVSAAMLAELGAGHVILGHSERRADHGETSALVRAKTLAAHGAGLVAIVCIGETLDEREAGRTLEVVTGQLTDSLPDTATAADTVVAYEPVWAIGTGKVATTDQIAEVHAALRAALVDRFGDAGAAMRLLYGGSVKAANAAEIFAVPDVDGALVGGASLTAADLSPIVAALDAAR